MPQQGKPPVTQRAYTLRLRGADPQDTSWREALWQTHEAVNKGAKAFGDWLLTLRGGLEHTLADEKIKLKKKKGETKEQYREPAAEERKARRILLALSWLSVESKLGAPEKFVIASGQDDVKDRNGKVVAALEGVLKEREVPENEITGWKNDCSASLSAAIRDDAVWINRNKAFDEACGGQNKQKAREDAKTLLWFLLTDDYLVLLKKPEKKQPTAVDQKDEDESSDGEASAEAIAKSGKGAGQRTRQPFSHIFGKRNTQGSGKPTITLNLRDHWQEHLKPLVTATGIPLRDPNTMAKKGNPPSPTELHREMFSKAAARLAQIWTKQKQQEMARQLRTAADEELKKLEGDNAYCGARILLDTFCRERGQATGSLEEYRINPRALKGWDRIIAAWGKITETDSVKATEKRIEEAKRLQDEDADKKFGDINLFASLAEPEYEPVWRHNGQALPSILEIYVKGWKARTNAVRLKVAAFRHPAPYFHPVFCQFGVSRPQIKYGRLDKNDQGDARNVQMRLWTGSQAKNVTLLAVSNRFDKEIGSAEASQANEPKSSPEVTRQSRLGVAAIRNPGGTTTYRVAHVFDEQEVRSRKRTDGGDPNDEPRDEGSPNRKQKKPLWNGTLQADRRELEAIGRMESSKPEKARKAKQQLRWWLIVSLKLQPQGPWCEFAAVHQLKIDPQYWPHAEENKKRKGHAKLILSRLPGLRILSVDLGHRYAASCAVWEALSGDQMNDACRAAKHDQPQEDDIYLHLKKKVKKQKKGKEVEVEKTTIYRRIGADTLPDGAPHPAPWARLDRQFIIKLQGEEISPRKAGLEEIKAVEDFEQAVGRPAPENRSLGVADLMRETVRTARLAIKDHGHLARIAYNLTAEKKLLPGGKEEKLTHNDRVEMLQDLLVTWHTFTHKKRPLKEIWDKHIATLAGYEHPKEITEDIFGKDLKNIQSNNRDKLRVAAETLSGNQPLCMKLHCQIATLWRQEDKLWKQRLRWLRDWILPRGAKAKDPAIRHTGGLSLDRITTIKSLYQVQKAFFMRPDPEDLKKNIPAKGQDDLRGFGQGILDTMEHLREQRVKQLASRIAEAALGIGRMKRSMGSKTPTALTNLAMLWLSRTSPTTGRRRPVPGGKTASLWRGRRARSKNIWPRPVN